MIIGATSGIGKALAELYAGTDARIAVAGRREGLLRELAARHAGKFVCCACDVSRVDLLESRLDEMLGQLGGLDLVIISAGTGAPNPGLSFRLEEPALQTNVSGWTCAVDWAVRQFERQGSGHLVSISSVAGLRGSRVGPAYAASKAYQINYLEGMRQKVGRKNIHVTDIRPGFVDTAMARGEGLFWVAPVEKAGRQIFAAIRKRKKVAYVTRRWRVVAGILRWMPSSLYCRM